VDLLSLDVEMAELGILQMLPWDHIKIRVVLLEAISNRATLSAFM
jgi:hypothetical protein